MNLSRYTLSTAFAALLWSVQAPAVTISATASVSPATSLSGVTTSAPDSFSSSSAFGSVQAQIFEGDGGLMGSIDGNTDGVVDAFLVAETWVSVAYTPTTTYDGTLSYSWQKTLTNGSNAPLGYELDFGIGSGSL